MSEELELWILVICLAAASLWDLKTKLIPLPIILLMLGTGAFLRFLEGDLFKAELLLRLLPGIFAMAVSWKSHGLLGLGDGLLLLGMGLWMSPERLLGAGLAAFFGAGLVGLLLLVCFRKKKDYAMPFAPFLMSGTLLVLLGSGGMR